MIVPHIDFLFLFLYVLVVGGELHAPYSAILIDVSGLIS